MKCKRNGELDCRIESSILDSRFKIQRCRLRSRVFANEYQHLNSMILNVNQPHVPSFPPTNLVSPFLSQRRCVRDTQGPCVLHQSRGLPPPTLSQKNQVLSGKYFPLGLQRLALYIIAGMSLQYYPSNMLYGEEICMLAITAVMRR